MESNKKYWCFKCKTFNEMEEAKDVDTEFRSQKKGIAMKRKTVVGRCSACKNTIRSFKKSEAEISTKPIEPPIAAIPNPLVKDKDTDN